MCERQRENRERDNTEVESVCATKRDREKKDVKWCVRDRQGKRDGNCVCLCEIEKVCVRERERETQIESMCVCVCVCVRERERESVCLCE